jgi:tetratricopeptide (TPR) repeat protein
MRYLLYLGFALLLGYGCSTAIAAPYIPKSDSEVLERLPFKASAGEGSELRALRRAQAEKPQDLERALALAQRYFDLASAEGDPRYVGYAEAVIRPWSNAATPPVESLIMRALIRQYRHEFDAALADLGRAAEIDPGIARIWSWRAAILLVQADYAGARAACARLAPLASVLLVTSCNAAVDARTGKAELAYTELSAGLARRPDAEPELQLWIQTRLAEAAMQLGRSELAERHFKAGLALGITDGYILAAYADFLLDQGRPLAAVSLLKDWERSDVLLLRLALAEQAAGLPSAAAHVKMLQERFDASALRGDKLHQQDEARFHLAMLGDPRGAVRLAAENYRVQREASDARMLMEAALAAKDYAAAQPALDWMKSSGYEDPVCARLALLLRAGAK